MLVKKASLQLFLEEQFKSHEAKIIELIQNSDNVSKLIEDFVSTRSKLKSLKAEIETDSNAEILAEIMEDARIKEDELSQFLNSLPGVTGAVASAFVKVIRSGKLGI